MSRLRIRIKKWLNRTLLIKQILPVYLFLGLAIVGGLNRFDSLSEQRVADRFAVAAQLDYTQCLARVENRTAVRNVFNGILNQLPASEEITRIEEYLDTAYPLIDSSSCNSILREAGIKVEEEPIPED